MTGGAPRAGDEVDYSGIGLALRRHRLAIVVVALIGAAIGYALGALLIKVRADSFLQLSYTAPVTAPDEKADKEGKDLRFRTNIAEYKVLNATILGRNGFLDYAGKDNKLDPELIARLREALARENLLSRWIRPVFAIARADLREIPEQQSTDANYLVGVDISVDRRSPDEALAIATALGDYVRDSAILLRAREFATGLNYKASSRLLDLDRQLISMRLSLAQAESKQKELAAIRTRYPDASHGDARQVVSVDRGTSRFLTPVAQLVGVESQIADIHEAIHSSEWDIERSKALIAFLEPAQTIVRESRTGADMFQRLDKLAESTFNAQRMKADPWRDASNTIKIETVGLKTLYFDRMLFVTPPTLSQIPLWMRLAPALAGLVAGALLAAFAILAAARLRAADATA